MSKKKGCEEVMCPFCQSDIKVDGEGGRCDGRGCGAYWINSDDTGNVCEAVQSLTGKDPKSLQVTTWAVSGVTFLKLASYVDPGTPPNLVMTLASDGDFPFSQRLAEPAFRL